MPASRIPTALVTGVNGQDGSYLADLLTGKGYRVIGTVRSESSDRWRIAHLESRIELVELDLGDPDRMRELVETFRPTEVYNVAARASSAQLEADPAATGQYNGIAVVHWLETLRSVDASVRFCQASSSEMFGNTDRSPQDETTPFRPRNAYGAAKLYAHWMTANFRDTHGLFACSAILFNHESPRRGQEFVTRKVTRAAARIAAGLQDRLELGSLDARRDWGFAGDYVAAMWRMLQAPMPADYVVATGETHSVRELCEIAFSRVGLDYSRYVVESADLKRAPEAVPLVGNPSKAREQLGWKPTISFVQMIETMVDADVRAIGAGTAVEAPG